MVDKKSILNLSKYCLLLRIRVTSERNYNSRGKIHMYGQICLFESILTPLNGTHEVEANSHFLLKKAGIKSRSLKNKSKITISLSSKFSYKSFHLFGASTNVMLQEPNYSVQRNQKSKTRFSTAILYVNYKSYVGTQTGDW